VKVIIALLLLLALVSFVVPLPAFVLLCHRNTTTKPKPKPKPEAADFSRFGVNPNPQTVKKPAIISKGAVKLGCI
jgi:hypothetical protein